MKTAPICRAVRDAICIANCHYTQYLCSFTDHKLPTQITDSCVVINEPYLYRL